MAGHTYPSACSCWSNWTTCKIALQPWQTTGKEKKTQGGDKQHRGANNESTESADRTNRQMIKSRKMQINSRKTCRDWCDTSASCHTHDALKAELNHRLRHLPRMATSCKINAHLRVHNEVHVSPTKTQAVPLAAVVALC